VTPALDISGLSKRFGDNLALVALAGAPAALVLPGLAMYGAGVWIVRPRPHRGDR
jgi:hypothetical protein